MTKGIGDLQKRLMLTILLVAIFRFGVHIPVPGVDGRLVSSFFDSQKGILGLFNTFSGGALNQFSIFALGITPYISSSIIFQLLGSVVPYLESLKKEGEIGRKKITQFTRYGTVVLAIFQGLAIGSWLLKQSIDGNPLVRASEVGFLSFEIFSVVTLVAGTCFVMWLGEQIADRGLSEGSSIIIFAGIAANIPSGALKLFGLYQQNSIRFAEFALILALVILVVGSIIFLEIAQRKIPIHSSRGTAEVGPIGSYLPFKINLSGVIPPIFASSLLIFPATVAGFLKVPFLKEMANFLSPGAMLYNLAFVLLITFFCFFYTEVVMNPQDLADNLKKGGKFVPGIRAGNSTVEYLSMVMERMNWLGAVYLSCVSVLPGILIERLHVPFYFGGTSLLILVGVSISVIQQFQTAVMSQKYEGLLAAARQGKARVRF